MSSKLPTSNNFVVEYSKYPPPPNPKPIKLKSPPNEPSPVRLNSKKSPFRKCENQTPPPVPPPSLQCSYSIITYSQFYKDKLIKIFGNAKNNLL